ncbi:hypothetical protein TWF281_004016 [Arthrobotrys megalospora]
MFHSRKTKNIKDLPIYGGPKPKVSAATGPVAKQRQTKDTSGQKRKLGSMPEGENDLQPSIKPAKRFKRANDLMAELGTLNDKGPKALREIRNPPMTPQNKVLSDFKIWDYSPPKTTESDKAIRTLVEERMNNEAKCQGLPEQTRAIVLKARCDVEKKKIKVKEMRERRARVEGWSSFRSRLERGRLPADKHLRGPLLVREKRVTRGRPDHDGVDGDVKEILERWRNSAVVEGVANAPASPWEGREAAARAAEEEREKEKDTAPPAKPRYDLGSDLLAKPTVFDALRAKFEKGEIKKKEMVKRVGAALKKCKEELIEGKTKAYEAKKARLIGARDEILAAANQVKQELEDLKARCCPENVAAARRTVKLQVGRLTARYEALMAEHKLAFEKVVKAEKELLALKSKVASLPTGNPAALGKFKEQVVELSSNTIKEVEVKQKEGLRKQLKREKRALRALQRS